MQYNKTLHQYILTEDDIRDGLGVELTSYLGDDKEVPIFLREVSSDLYTWFYSKMLRTNVPLVEYILATDDEYKEAVYTALLAQARKMLRSGSQIAKDKINPANPNRVQLDDIVPEDAKIALWNTNLISMRRLYFKIPEGQIKGVTY
jgi:hypothetical protein